MKQRFLLLLFIALLMPIGAWAALAVGDKFTVDGMTFQVTSISPNEVQVGANNYYAIDQKTEGAVDVPSAVTGSDGISYPMKFVSQKS